MSRRSATTGGGKKVAFRSCAFPSGVVSREPSGLERGGVIVVVGVSCLCTAHLVIFHSPFGDDAASVTLSRWACRRCLLISLPFWFRALLYAFRSSSSLESCHTRRSCCVSAQARLHALSNPEIALGEGLCQGVDVSMASTRM
jgi:hypothetical protein